jgi:hypothetical protein
LGVSALEVGTDLLRNGLDCGNKIVVREGVFGDKFVGRDGMVFLVLIYVQATEGHGEKKGESWALALDVAARTATPVRNPRTISVSDLDHVTPLSL